MKYTADGLRLSEAKKVMTDRFSPGLKAILKTSAARKRRTGLKRTVVLDMVPKKK